MDSSPDLDGLTPGELRGTSLMGGIIRTTGTKVESFGARVRQGPARVDDAGFTAGGKLLEGDYYVSILRSLAFQLAMNRDI